MLNFQEWLETPTKVRGILVEAGVSAFNTGTSLWEDKVMYLSNTGYLTSDSLTSYLPIITGGVQFSESLGIDGSISMSFGDIEVANPNGEYDSWLDSTKYVWVNKSVKVYYGDTSKDSSSLADIQTNTFEKIFDGIIADVDYGSRNTLNIKVRDKLERLNTPLTENKLGNTYFSGAGTNQSNQDTIRPLIFGEAHNITPLLLDPSLLSYIFNDGISESLIEVRDNGIPVVLGSTDLAAGTFTLLRPSAGTITCSVQGTKNSSSIVDGTSSSTYINTVAKIIATICMKYGNEGSRLLASDIDFNNLQTFEISHPQAVGVLVSDRENILNVCTFIANSVGAQLYFNRFGKLQLLKLGTYTTDTPINITSSDILLDSLAISARSTVVAATKIGYCKNYTVQSNLVTSIPMAHKTMFAEEWYSKTAIDSSVKTQYKLNSDPVQKDTAILSGTDAAAEALRLNNFFKQPRNTYRMTCSTKLLNVKLGQEVVLHSSRFGLDLGKSGQVVSLTPNWLKATVDIEVLI